MFTNTQYPSMVTNGVLPYNFNLMVTSSFHLQTNQWLLISFFRAIKCNQIMC